ncbi:MAG TPA: tripartite tricarboxylate transporter substrate binding protein [Burkholderiales bacterium]|nr:tripartite tricarboxylate transporter substrate binding protein [Burkholderiales bacterium]
MKLLKLLACLAAVAAAAPAAAQTQFPSKPIRMVVPFPPGGTLDILARTVGGKLSANVGQPVVTENRPGAQGAIGAEVVAKAPPDGHILLIMSNTLVTLPSLRKDLPFHPLRDFTPVIELGATPTVLTVHPSFPARNLQEFIKAARATKGGVSYNSPGTSSPPHLAGELFARAADVPMVHVPYKGTAPAVVDLLGGQIPAMMAPLNAVLPHLQAGKLHAIVVTDARRAKDLPNVPTVREAGVPTMAPVSSWFGLLTAPNTPAPLVQRLNAEINKVLQDPEVRARLEEQTFELRGGTSEALAALMKEEMERNARIVADAKITVN